MGIFHWVAENIWDILQTVGIVGAFVTIRRARKNEKVQNRIHFTERHADLLRERTHNRRLYRITRGDADLSKIPLTMDEETHLREVFEHFSATYYASKRDAYDQPAALPQDIRSFFALPIPKVVWHKTKLFHDPDFVVFVESHFEH